MYKNRRKREVIEILIVGALEKVPLTGQTLYQNIYIYIYIYYSDYVIYIVV